MDGRPVRSISISPDGQRIAVISADGVAIIDWTLQETLEYYKFDLSRSPDIANGYYWSWSHLTVLDIHWDGFTLHHSSHQHQPSLPNSQLSPAYKLFLSPDSRHLITVHESNQVYLWDVKSGHQIQLLNELPSGFSRNVQIQHAPDSSCALLWNEDQLAVLWISSCLFQLLPLPVNNCKNPGTSQSKSKILGSAFFPSSNRILIIESSGSMSILLLDNMAYKSMPSSHFPLKTLRDLTISPMEHLIVICSDIGLSVHGIDQDIHQTPLSSAMVMVAKSSPNDAHIYVVETTIERWMVSHVNTSNWAVQRIY
ncbi:6761_t:CDS:1, partial [Acaulospora colombiana]